MQIKEVQQAHVAQKNLLWRGATTVEAPQNIKRDNHRLDRKADLSRRAGQIIEKKLQQRQLVQKSEPVRDDEEFYLVQRGWTDDRRNS